MTFYAYLYILQLTAINSFFIVWNSFAFIAPSPNILIVLVRNVCVCVRHPDTLKIGQKRALICIRTGKIWNKIMESTRFVHLLISIVICYVLCIIGGRCTLQQCKQMAFVLCFFTFDDFNQNNYLNSRLRYALFSFLQPILHRPSLYSSIIIHIVYARQYRYLIDESFRSPVLLAFLFAAFFLSSQKTFHNFVVSSNIKTGFRWLTNCYIEIIAKSFTKKQLFRVLR